jgi:hypothetical protein
MRWPLVLLGALAVGCATPEPGWRGDAVPQDGPPTRVDRPLDPAPPAEVVTDLSLVETLEDPMGRPWFGPGYGGPRSTLVAVRLEDGDAATHLRFQTGLAGEDQRFEVVVEHSFDPIDRAYLGFESTDLISRDLPIGTTYGFGLEVGADGATFGARVGVTAVWKPFDLLEFRPVAQFAGAVGEPTSWILGIAIGQWSD